jgi:hypothetical protein
MSTKSSIKYIFLLIWFEFEILIKYIRKIIETLIRLQILQFWNKTSDMVPQNLKRKLNHYNVLANQELCV